MGNRSAVARNPRGGFLIAGSTSSFGLPGRAWLFAVDEEGGIGDCPLISDAEIESGSIAMDTVALKFEEVMVQPGVRNLDMGFREITLSVETQCAVE